MKNQGRMGDKKCIYLTFGYLFPNQMQKKVTSYILSMNYLERNVSIQFNDIQTFCIYKYI